MQRADYPRLVALADKHNLWTDDTTANAGLFGRGDGSATMVLPNWIDRMEQFAGGGAGAAVEEGLPNITGVVGGVPTTSADHSARGAFKLINPPGLGEYAANNQRNYTPDYDFNASWSNPIYGKSTTVQPAAIKVIPIIRY